MGEINKNKILNFLEKLRISHKEMVNIYTKGSCYNLYLLLDCVFPNCEAWYDGNHIITKIKKDFFDIEGIVTDVENYEPLHNFFSKDDAIIVVKELMAGSCHFQNDSNIK